jgi:DNA replication protein DnaC
MVRQSDQEGALLLSNVSRPGNRRIRAPNQRTRLLILDDWAMIRLTAEQRRDLMEVIDDRHDRAATLLASQIPVSGWFDQIGDATATVHRPSE